MLHKNMKSVEKPPEKTEEYHEKCLRALSSAQLKVGTDMRMKHDMYLDNKLLKQVVVTAMGCSGDIKDNLARAYADYFMRKNGYAQWIEKANEIEDKMKTQLKV